MRKNKFFMLGIITVFVAILSLTFVSSTFARYTSTVSGYDTAKVALWQFTFTNDVQGDDHALTTIDLFKSDVYDLDADGEGNVIVGQNDAEINDNAVTPIIAPGSGGYATFDIHNDSDVTATYQINFTADEDSVPLQWSKDNENWVDNITDLNIAPTELTYKTGHATVKLYWRWVYNEGSSSDTAIGQEPKNPRVDVEVILTQKD